MLLLVSMADCGEKGKQAKASDPVALKTQLEALEKTKQFKHMLHAPAQNNR